MRGASFAVKKEAAASSAAAFFCPDLCGVLSAVPFQSAACLLHNRHEDEAASLKL